MPSNWDVYFVLLLSALLALSIPLGLAAISLFIPKAQSPVESSGAHPETQKLELSLSSGSSKAKTRVFIGEKINSRFFLGVNAALILIILSLTLIPSVSVIQGGIETELVLKGILAVVSISVFSVLGLLYSVRKGDLSWLTTYQEKRLEKRNHQGN